MMKTSLRAALIASLFAAGGGTAMAADMRAAVPSPALAAAVPYNWSGLYLGGHLGYSWGQGDATFTGTGLGGSLDSNGALFGGQLGVNWQVGSWVLGLEGELSWSGASGSNTIAGTSLNADANWYATLAGRFGYAFDRWLVYGKGGAAWANIDYSSPLGSAGTTRSGWMLGAGIEYGLTPNWSAKLEYNYLDLGTADLVLPPAVSVDNKTQTIKAGVNYRFNWDGPVR